MLEPSYEKLKSDYILLKAKFEDLLNNYTQSNRVTSEFIGKLLNSVSELFDSKDSSDILVLFQDGKMFGHKFLLKLFLNFDLTNTQISFAIPYLYGHLIFKWIYTNKINLSTLTPKEIADIILYTKTLQLNELNEICQDYLIPKINRDNSLEIYQKAYESQAEKVLKHSLAIISNYWSTYTPNDFKMLKALVLYSLLEIYSTDLLENIINHGRMDVLEIYFEYNINEIPQILSQLTPDGSIPIDYAIRLGYIDLAKSLIEHKANLNSCDKMDRPLLHLLILRGEYSMANYLMDHGCDCLIKNLHTKQNILHICAIAPSKMKTQQEFTEAPSLISLEEESNNESNFYAELIKRFISLGADINALNMDCKTPLQLAIEHNNTIAFDTFIEHGIALDIHNIRDKWGHSLLWSALNIGRKYDGDCNLTNMSTNTLLNGNSTFDDSSNPFDLTEDENFEINFSNDHFKAKYNNYDSEVESNRKDHENSIAQQTDFSIAAKLIEKGVAYKDVINPVNGVPLLNELLLSKNFEGALFLIHQQGINFNCRDNMGFRPIHILASSLEYISIAKQIFLLFKHSMENEENESYYTSKNKTESSNPPPKIDLNAVTLVKNQTALHIAILAENWDFIDSLFHLMDMHKNSKFSEKEKLEPKNDELDQKPLKPLPMLSVLDLNVIDSDENSPLSLALIHQNFDLATKLMFHGANLHLKYGDGRSLLERCLLNGQESQAIFLLENGANYNRSLLKGQAAHEKNKLSQNNFANNNNNYDNSIEGSLVTNCGPLMRIAIEKGLVKVVRALCQMGCDLNAPFQIHSPAVSTEKAMANSDSQNKLFPFNPLWVALVENQLDVASILVQYGCDTNYWAPEALDSKISISLLHRSIYHHMENAACFLVRSNCQIHFSSHNKQPKDLASLRIKTTNENEDSEHKLIKSNESPLHLACAFGMSELVSCLLEHGSDINTIDDKGRIALHIAIESHGTCIPDSNPTNNKSNHHENKKEYDFIIYTLLAHPLINLTIKDKPQGKTAFERAMVLKNHTAAQSIIDREPSAAEQVDNKGYNFLHTSIKMSDIENVLFLLAIKANVNSRVQDNLQNTPLHIAAQYATEIIVRNLLLAGSDINAKNSHSQSPLHVAISHGRVDIARIFLENGADLFAADNNGNNILHMAIMNGHLECVEMILSETELPIEMINTKGRNALQLIGIYVKDNGVAMFELFTRFRADQVPLIINLPDEDGNTALLHAYLNGRGNLCRALVKAGSSLGNVNNEGICIFKAPVASHQLLFKLLDMLTEEPTWTDSDFCNECNTKFGITMRKHHCRHCGRVLCTKCSDKMVPIPKFNLPKPVRVCSVCYDVLAKE